MCGFSGFCSCESHLFFTVHDFHTFSFYRTVGCLEVPEGNLVVIELLPAMPITIFNATLC